MRQIQLVPYGDSLGSFLRKATKTIRISSPFITSSGIRYVGLNRVPTEIITKVTLSNVLQKSLDAHVLFDLIKDGVVIRSIPNLHAKLYFVDSCWALVTSSNLTGSGLQKNVELGLTVSDSDTLAQLETVWGTFHLKSTIVTVESLRELLDQVPRYRAMNGLWRAENIQDGDELSPMPMVGAPYFAKNIDPTEALECEPDETGDVFTAMPSEIDALPTIVSDNPPLVVQGFINTFFALDRLAVAAYIEGQSKMRVCSLADPNRPYPYKRKILERLIGVATPEIIASFIDTLVSDSSNEVQFLYYHNALRERIAGFSDKQREKILSTLSETISRLLSSVGKDTCTKNFSKVLLDGIYKILQLPLPKQAVDAPTCMVGVPGYQQIRRQREALGNDAVDLFAGWATEVTNGAWDGHLPSVLALAKEVGKIDMPSETSKTITRQFRGFCSRVDGKMRTTVEQVRQLIELKVSQTTNTATKEQLRLVLYDLKDWRKANLGRLVSLEGQTRKTGTPVLTREEKDLVDWLSTYQTVRKAIEKMSTT